MNLSIRLFPYARFIRFFSLQDYSYVYPCQIFVEQELEDLVAILEESERGKVFQKRTSEFNGSFFSTEADNEMIQEARAEWKICQAKLNLVEMNVIDALLPNNRDDPRNAILEVFSNQSFSRSVVREAFGIRFGQGQAELKLLCLHKKCFICTKILRSCRG